MGLIVIKPAPYAQPVLYQTPKNLTQGLQYGFEFMKQIGLLCSAS